MVLLELGGAFTAALAIDGGQIVDGFGGSSGPLGARAAGALDGELAYLLGAGAAQAHAVSPAGRWIRPATGAIGDLSTLWSSPAHAEGWTALLEAAAKAVRGLLAIAADPAEIVVSGRLARLPELIDALAASLGDVAPVVRADPGPGERGRIRRRAAGRRAHRRPERGI